MSLVHSLRSRPLVSSAQLESARLYPGTRLLNRTPLVRGEQRPGPDCVSASPSRPVPARAGRGTRASPSPGASRRSSVEMPLLTISTVVEPSDSENESSISCSLEGSSSKVQVITSRCGRSISVYSPARLGFVPSGLRITTRTSPPTRRSTSASGVPSRARVEPAPHHLGARPGVEHVLGRGVEGPLDPHRAPRLLGHRCSFRSSRYSPTTSNRRSQRSRWLSIQSEARRAPPAAARGGGSCRRSRG